MARDANTLALVFKTLLDSRPWQDDSAMLEIPWRQEKVDAIKKRSSRLHAPDGRLVFGMMTCDGYVRPHPTVRRAVDHVESVLKGHGHEVSHLVANQSNHQLIFAQVVKWEPPPHNTAVEDLVSHS